MTSRGRSSPEYRDAAADFRTGRYPCEIRGPHCTGVGTWVDHDPPLSSAPTPEQWTGRFRPACPSCQRRQGPAISNLTRVGRTPPDHSAWSWPDR